MEDETMLRHVLILSVVFLSGGVQALAGSPIPVTNSESPRKESIESLRARGPDGLKQALRKYDELDTERQQLWQEHNRLITTDREGQKEPLARIEKQITAIEDQMKLWQPVIDQVGGQRSCTVSRLFWYTDLDKAKAAAKSSGRPILSLRMLGKLTDECSCANSRFFRTALYSNKEISDYLRDNFILHWQSVRPVPRVTIDFGDGRKLERTVTGNSAHYVLSSTGEPLDVLPGLYSPQAFLQWLRTMRGFAELSNHVQQSAAASGPRLADMLKRHHQDQLNAIMTSWDSDLQKLGENKAALVEARITSAMEATEPRAQQAANGPAPNARLAASRAVSKSAAERPLLRFASYGGPLMERGMDDDLWQAVANLHRDNVRLDESSVALMRREFPKAAVAARAAVGKARVEDPVLRLVRSFEDSITLDTVRNEYLLHRRVHELLARTESGSMDFNRLNEWVYAELFLTPSSDPWLGLARPDVYSALDNDGRIESVPPMQSSAHSEIATTK
jgi:hypothetical protein